MLDPIQIGLLLVLVGLALREWRRNSLRSAVDVYADLMQLGALSGREEGRDIAADGAEAERVLSSAKELSEMKPPRAALRRARLIPFAAAIGALLLTVLFSHGSPHPVLLAAVTLFFFSGGYLVSRRVELSLQANIVRQIEFFLPLVMERIVMAVQAGHDVISAVRTTVDLELEKKTVIDRTASYTIDPVTKLLSLVYKLTVAGRPFEEALKAVALKVECSPLRHAFIHLSNAHRDGGELVGPLKELSDSTQLYYQESIEEDIAKMPVKATMPLLCMFLGLVVGFLVTPMLHIISTTQSYSNGGLPSAPFTAPK